MKIKVALIGISGYGRVHFNQMRQLVECGLAEIAAAVVINPDQVQNELAVFRENWILSAFRPALRFMSR